MVTNDPTKLLKWWGELTLGNQRVKLLKSLASFKTLSPKQKQLVVTLSHQMNDKFKPSRAYAGDYCDWIDAPYCGDI